MNTATEQYIQQKLADLDKQTDMNDFVFKGRFSFGMDQKTYGHLPAWQNLVKQKKQLQRWLWIDAVGLALLVTAAGTDLPDTFAENWWKALLGMLAFSAIITLFFTLSAYATLFGKFRQTEREVRRLIYQDILFQLKKDAKEFV